MTPSLLRKGQVAPASRLSLDELKALVRSQSYATPASLSSSLFQKGLPLGALTQFSGLEGGGKTEFLLSFLAEHSGLRVAWVEDELSIYPQAFEAFGVSLERVLFVEAGQHTLWTLLQLMRSQLFPMLIYSPASSKKLKLRELRCLQLGAEKSQCFFALLTEASLQVTWVFTLHLLISRSAKKFSVQVLRDRFHLCESLGEIRA